MADLNLVYPYTFVGGEKAVADEVNADFDAIKLYAKELNSTISEMQSAIADLKDKPTREMFDIYFSITSNTPVGAYPLWTGETITNCKLLYPDFWKQLNKLADSGKVPTVSSESDYESKISTYGQCASFYIDTLNGHVRLPKITRFISSISALSEMAQEENAGLPDHSHNVRVDTGESKAGADTRTSYLARGYTKYSSPWSTQHRNGENSILLTSASASNSIYGASDTVQPPAVHLCLYLQVANNTAEISELDVDLLIEQMEEGIAALQSARDSCVKELWAEFEKIKAELADASAIYKDSDIEIAVSDWKSDSTYTDYPYCADIEEDWATVNSVPTVVFSLEDAVSGNFAPIAQSATGYVRIWAKTVPTDTITIQTLVLE